MLHYLVNTRNQAERTLTEVTELLKFGPLKNTTLHAGCVFKWAIMQPIMS